MRSVLAPAKLSFSARPPTQQPTGLLTALLTGLVAAVLLPSGCVKPRYPECKKDKHCKQDLGEKCTFGKCQNCTVNQDCIGKAPDGANWVCYEFRCQDPAGVPGVGDGLESGAMGSPCTESSECRGGLVCSQGVCSNCLEDAQCSGGTCDPDLGICVDPTLAGQCQTDDECAMDEICDLGACVFSGVVGGGDNPCGVEAIYFEFDSPRIDPQAQSQLDTVASCLQENDRMVYLEAHADPRGTEEYNILLTDRRGQAVKKYLTTKGVDGDKMQVVSKGNLEAQGLNEAEWAKDRRVEFIFP